MPDPLEPEWLASLSPDERRQRQDALSPLLDLLRASATKLGLSDLPQDSPRPIAAETALLPDGPEPSSLARDAEFHPFRHWQQERTAEELCGALLTESEIRNGALNAFARLHGKEAMAAARRADAARSVGRQWGPLHGIPVAVKENIAVNGWPLTGSSHVLGQQTASTDATVITRFRNSGAVLLGQTVMHELAFGMTSINPHLGAVRNPWDPARICGGSSGGSAAAVAAGLVPLALGSDTGGSVRCPAALCGVTGFKPSFGAVSRHGVLPLGGSLDTVGPIARTVAQCLAAHLAMAGEDPQDDATLGANRATRPAPLSLQGLRIGLPRPYFEGAMEEGVRRQVNLAVERLQKAGARVENVAFPDLEAVNAAAAVTLLVEAASFFSPFLKERERIGEDVRGRFEQGLLVPAIDWLNAQRLRARWKREVATLFGECDLLLTPASPVVASRIDDPYTNLGGIRVDARTAISRYLRSINFLGLPALSLPCGLDDARLPVAVQLVGAGFSDEWLLRVGILAEQVLAFHEKPPGALSIGG
ncbi:MAG: amidase [Bryobacterales bacterium]|nr:amidase [Bryobacterales bacterium]